MKIKHAPIIILVTIIAAAGWAVWKTIACEQPPNPPTITAALPDLRRRAPQAVLEFCTNRFVGFSSPNVRPVCVANR